MVAQQAKEARVKEHLMLNKLNSATQ